MALSLVKEKAEKVTLSLKKKGVTKVPPLRVVSVFDVSGSMDGNIRHGNLQKAADQVLGVAYKFDDDGNVNVFTFDSDVKQPRDMVVDDFGTYVQNVIVRGGYNTGMSTSYQTALQAVMDFLFAEKGGTKGLFGFGAKKGVVDDSPALVLFFTDGSPDRGDNARAVLRQAAGKNVYFQMIGVGGNADFSVLTALANEFNNVGEVRLTSFSMPDEAIYDQLISTEFVEWLTSHGALTGVAA